MAGAVIGSVAFAQGSVVGPPGYWGAMMCGGRGMMGGWLRGNNGNGSVADMPVSVDRARTANQSHLYRALPGTTLEEGINTFYDCCTLDVVRDGKIYGMLSVNGYGGQAWFHIWHGSFIQEEELS